MKCEGCGNENAWSVHKKKESLTQRIYEECNTCFDSTVPHNPDVYFRQPYWDENLHDFDDPHYDFRKGTFITSKSHKAYVLKKCGIREAGDSVNGKRNFDPISHRHAQASLRR